MENPPQRITIKDIARAAGVSAPTVSRALNDKPDISIETRQYIRKLAEEMGYTPNRAAQLLHQQASHTIEILSIGVDPGGMHMRGSHASLLETARELGYHTYFSILDTDTSYKEVIESMMSRQIDGLIVASGNTRATVNFLSVLNDRLPVVCIGEFDDPNYPSVVYNLEYGARASFDHLVSSGHTRIAEINYAHSLIRHETWIKQAAEHDVELTSFLTAAYTPEDGYQAAMQLLSEKHQITAVLAGNDSLAIGILHAFRQQGIAVPSDISVIGFDDNRYAAYQSPALTTVRQDQGLIGRISMEFLVSLIENPDEPAYQRVLKPELVVRDSTGPVHR